MAEPTQPAAQPVWDTALTNVAQPDSSHQTDGWITNEVPLSQHFNWLLSTINTWIGYLVGKLRLFPGFAADSTQIIQPGYYITPTQGNHAVDGQVSVSNQISNIHTDNLDDGRFLTLHTIAAGLYPAVNLIALAGGAGQIHTCDGNMLTMTANMTVVLQRRGADWYEVSRTIVVPNVNRQATLFTGSGSYTCIRGSQKIRAIGGGGGGASGYSTDPIGIMPTAGSDGGDTWVADPGVFKARGGTGAVAIAGGTPAGPGGAPTVFTLTPGPGAVSYGLAFGNFAGHDGVQDGAHTGGRWGTAGGAGGVPGGFFNPSLAAAGGAANGSPSTPGNNGANGMANTGCGGGGGGSTYGEAATAGGGGGASGEVVEYVTAFAAGSTVTIHVGAGGSGGAQGSEGGAYPGGVGGAGGSGFVIIEE